MEPIDLRQELDAMRAERDYHRNKNWEHFESLAKLQADFRAFKDGIANKLTVIRAFMVCDNHDGKFTTEHLDKLIAEIK